MHQEIESLRRKLGEETATSSARKREIDELKIALESAPKHSELIELKEEAKLAQRLMQQEKAMRVSTENHVKELEILLERSQQAISASAQNTAARIALQSVKFEMILLM